MEEFEEDVLYMESRELLDSKKYDDAFSLLKNNQNLKIHADDCMELLGAFSKEQIQSLGIEDFL